MVGYMPKSKSQMYPAQAELRRDVRVGLRSATGNRVYHQKWYRGFESPSLRHTYHKTSIGQDLKIYISSCHTKSSPENGDLSYLKRL
jgi:hypothetical protein